MCFDLSRVFLNEFAALVGFVYFLRHSNALSIRVFGKRLAGLVHRAGRARFDPTPTALNARAFSLL